MNGDASATREQQAQVHEITDRLCAPSRQRA